jgi:hypothetical protein
MPWIDIDFDADADSGEIRSSKTVSAPLSGRIRKYKLETSTGCEDRVHKTKLTITRVREPDDQLEIDIDVKDCLEIDGVIDPPYRVRAGEDYHVSLLSTGFKENEHVEGSASLYYTFFFSFKSDDNHDNSQDG